MSCIILKDGKPLKQKKFQTTPEDTKLFEQIKCLRINLENRRSLKQGPYFRIYSEDMKIIETNLPELFQIIEIH